MVQYTMIKITFNAFSFLKEKLKKQNISSSNNIMEVPKDYTCNQLIDTLGYKDGEVEYVFINHKVSTKETILKDGDRVALVPPGTPGPYRIFFGVKKLGGLNPLQL